MRGTSSRGTSRLQASWAALGQGDYEHDSCFTLVALYRPWVVIQHEALCCEKFERSTFEHEIRRTHQGETSQVKPKWSALTCQHRKLRTHTLSQGRWAWNKWEPIWTSITQGQALIMRRSSIYLLLVHLSTHEIKIHHIHESILATRRVISKLSEESKSGALWRTHSLLKARTKSRTANETMRIDYPTYQPTRAHRPLRPIGIDDTTLKAASTAVLNELSHLEIWRLAKPRSDQIISQWVVTRKSHIGIISHKLHTPRSTKSKRRETNWTRRQTIVWRQGTWRSVCSIHLNNFKY